MKKLLLLLALAPSLMWSQENLRKNLSEDGKTYIKASVTLLSMVQP